MIGSISVGVVTAQDPATHSVVVSLRTSGNVISVGVKVGLLGAADALRIKQLPLPALGSRGVIAFPYGDNRNGVWICSIFPSQMDAINNPGTPLDPYLMYDAHWSGFWSTLDGSGHYAAQFPDGSYIVAGSGTALPQTYRHTVGSGQVQQRVTYAASDRVASKPSPFSFALVLANGTQIQTDAVGDVTVTGASGVTLTLAVGSTTMAVSHTGIAISGNVSVSGTVTATQEGTFNGGHTVSQHQHYVPAAPGESNTPTG